MRKSVLILTLFVSEAAFAGFYNLGPVVSQKSVTYTLSQSSDYTTPPSSLVGLFDSDPTSGVDTQNELGPYIELDSSMPITTSSVSIGAISIAAPGGWGAGYLENALYQYYNGSTWVTLLTLSGFDDSGAPQTFTHSTVTASKFRITYDPSYGSTWLGVGTFIIQH